MTHRRPNRFACMFLIASLMIPLLVSAQEAEVPLPPPGYTPPTRADWLQAKLNPIEYDMAVRYEVSLDDWAEMDSSRRAHKTGGWACIGLGLLVPAVEATIIWGGGFPLDHHPNQEVYIVVTVAALATIITGIVLLAGSPGPEDFKRRWMLKEGQTDYSWTVTPGGLAFSF
ncbi:MAG: hypothetical protein JRJ19_10945 [Deltaproteobacteria bacterium]|nr:hypothetical protein [Deltaproteobacteria bacterium]MBW1872575.1 hypothetical protein [Deltaproteobacteria bacterium]